LAVANRIDVADTSLPSNALAFCIPRQ